jgi:hypothetical protein
MVSPSKFRQAAGDDAEGFAAGVGVDGGDPLPVVRRRPVDLIFSSMVGSPIDNHIPTWKSDILWDLWHLLLYRTSLACFKTSQCGQDQGGRPFQPEA